MNSESKVKCAQCNINFGLSSAAKALLEKLCVETPLASYPLASPKLCPRCRAQRRYLWRGELHLFTRKSALTGKNILTFYPPCSPVKVYDYDEWWSDEFDPLEYGREFDFSRPFFDQFGELVKSVPLISRGVTSNEENCDYINCASWNRNCYLLAGANHNEDCYYGNYVNRSKRCIDNNFIDRCELCYECVDCASCYDSRYLQNCVGCSESAFLFSCRDCHNCFGSVNLSSGKEFYFLNEKLSKAQYEERLAGLQLHTRDGVERARSLFDLHKAKFPVRYMIGELNEDCSGDRLRNCKDSTDCFDATDLWNCHHCAWLHSARDCMDIVSWGFPAELCYECTETGAGSYHCMFSVSTYGSNEVLYSYNSKYSKFLFGCSGIKRGAYCILNRQYSETDYFKQVDLIIKHMQLTGEWGEFFPASISPLAYNTSIAQDYFPLTKEEVTEQGWLWNDCVMASRTTGGSAGNIPPESSLELNSSVIGRVYNCAATGSPYKLIRQEVDFYTTHGIPAPKFSFFERHKMRMFMRNPRKLSSCECGECGKPIETSYPPDNAARILCEECYLTHVE